MCVFLWYHVTFGVHASCISELRVILDSQAPEGLQVVLDKLGILAHQALKDHLVPRGRREIP